MTSVHEQQARDEAIAAFLSAHGWGRAGAEPMAGDASARRYVRLRAPDGGTAILMDAGPDQAGSTGRFVRLAGWLSGNGFSAPRILAADAAQGLLIVEDLGEALFADLLRRDPAREGELAGLACEVLHRLADLPPPEGLAALDPQRLGALVAEALPWHLRQPPAACRAAADRLAAAIEADAAGIDEGRRIFAHRDYFAGNLVLLADRRGHGRTGILDFQDAVLAHPAYDLVSYLQDVRRAVPAGLEQQVIAAFCDRSGADRETFAASYAVLGAQRALRIAGVFARLIDAGKTRYAAHLPRTWRLVARNLAHPAAAETARAVAELGLLPGAAAGGAEGRA